MSTLLIIPLMLLLILVFHMDKTVAVVISVLALFIGQSVFSPINKQRKEMKQRKQEERNGDPLDYQGRGRKYVVQEMGGRKIG